MLMTTLLNFIAFLHSSTNFIDNWEGEERIVCPMIEIIHEILTNLFHKNIQLVDGNKLLSL